MVYEIDIHTEHFHSNPFIAKAVEALQGALGSSFDTMDLGAVYMASVSLESLSKHYGRASESQELSDDMAARIDDLAISTKDFCFGFAEIRAYLSSDMSESAMAESQRLAKAIRANTRRELDVFKRVFTFYFVAISTLIAVIMALLLR